MEALSMTGGDYSAISAREEKDLQQLMQQCDSAVSNAQAFADQLAQDLSLLDGVLYLEFSLEEFFYWLKFFKFNFYSYDLL